MQEINERFKDVHPEQTVAKIQSILSSLGIQAEEQWYDSGLEECWTSRVFIKDAFPFSSNGKGVSKALARASGYGEFIERLQCGLSLYKYQSIARDPKMNLDNYAPDGKYMTLQELEENGDWMDHIIEAYGNGLTRKKLAAQCKAYACTDEDRVWTVPYYSLFEKKYVYLPAGFVEHIYAANGCCAGNSLREACIHALSEIMERRSTITMLAEGKAAPPIPESVIEKFPTATKIINAIRAGGRYDIQLFDFSLGNGFPVIGTRIIDRKTHKYNVNVCADPILEIAIDRTLTELFQGKHINNFSVRHNGSLSDEASHLPISHNILNQLENGNALFSVDFFTEELSCDRECTDFADLSTKDNRELLAYMLDLYRELGKPLYIRNYSFLGFNSHKLVVPGFSESRGFRLVEPICEYALGDMVYKTFRNVASASDAELVMLLNFHTKIRTELSRITNFRGLAGLPMDKSQNELLTFTTLAYAAYRLGRLPAVASYIDALLNTRKLSDADAAYFSCVARYLRLKKAQVEDKKIRLVLSKLYQPQDVERLYHHLDNGETPFDNYLLHCDPNNCRGCQYQAHCSYTRSAEVMQKLGEQYAKFVNGQDESVFSELIQPLTQQ